MKKEQIIALAQEKIGGGFKVRKGAPDARYPKNDYFLYQYTDGTYQMPGTHGELITHAKTLTEIYNELSDR